jgi:hypothetical protein
MAFQRVIHIQTLGSFRVEETGRIIGIPRTKEKALLAFLAVNAGRAFRRDYLASFLWPHSSHEKARHSLNQAVSTLRRAVPQLIIADQASISINRTAVTTDLDAICDGIESTSLLERLNFIRGEFLGDINLSDAEDFESWRSNYNRDLFFRLSDAIRSEIDAVPRALQNSIYLRLSSVPKGLLPAMDIPEAELKEADISIGREARPSNQRFVLPFVGRESQMARLMESWQEAKRGVPQYVAVEGHAGYGKTRLLDEFIALLHDHSAIVLRARCYESGKALSLGPFIEILAKSITAEDLAGLQPIWISALQEVIPSLPVHAPTLPKLSQAASQSRLYEAMLRVITTLATRSPLVICVDDTQWLDKSSGIFMDFLAHRLGTARVLLLVTKRSHLTVTATPKDAIQWVSIQVGELSEQDIRSAIADLGPWKTSRKPSVQNLERSTKGHPFLVSEVVKSAFSHAEPIDSPLTAEPDGVNAFVSAVLGDLPPLAQKTAAALAVIGRPASMSLVAPVARVKQIGPAIDLLIRKDIAYESGARVGLRHDLISEAVYRKIPPFTRREMHKRAAVVLSRRWSRSGETAEHYLKAGNRRNAYRFALRAARHAESRHSNEETIYFLQLARSVSPVFQLKLFTKLAELLYRAHRIDEARNAFSELLANPAVPPLDRIVLTVRDLELGYNLGVISAEDLRHRLNDVKAVASDNPAIVAEILYLLARSAFHSGDQVSAAAATYELKTLADYFLSKGHMEAMAFAAHFHSALVSATEADEWAAPLRDRLNEAHDHEQKLRILVALTGVAYAVGRLVEALRYADAASREIERVGAMNLWPVNAAYTHMLYVEQGRFTDAIRLRQTIQERLSDMFLDIASTVSANAALMHYERGDFNYALEEVAFGLSSAVNRQSAWTELVLHGIQGLAALETGDFTTAARNADFGRERIESLGTRMADMSYVEILIARVDTFRGRGEEALARLTKAIHDYESRDRVCQIRLKLEQARLLKKQNKAMARTIAKEVYENARQMNAVLIAEKADALLLRL